MRQAIPVELPSLREVNKLLFDHGVAQLRKLVDEMETGRAWGKIGVEFFVNEGELVEVREKRVRSQRKPKFSGLKT